MCDALILHHVRRSLTTVSADSARGLKDTGYVEGENVAIDDALRSPCAEQRFGSPAASHHSRKLSLKWLSP
jgi:hypothetical protein